MKITFSKIGGMTLVGVCSKDFPIDWGNCFSVIASDDRHYRILNFVWENLKNLIEQKGLTYPIEINVIRDGYAIITDERIGKEWYRNEYCRSCCPNDLLSVEQRDKIKREGNSDNMTVLPADPSRNLIGFVCYEKTGYLRYDIDALQKIEIKK